MNYSVEITDPKGNVVTSLKDLKSPTVPSGKQWFTALNMSPFILQIEGEYTVTVKREDGASGEAVLSVKSIPPK